MKKGGVIILIIVSVIILVIAAYFFLWPKGDPKPIIVKFVDTPDGEFATTAYLESFCNLNQKHPCGVPMPCEGEKIDIIGYTRQDHMELRGVVGTSIPLVYIWANRPESSAEYFALRDNTYWTGVSVKEDDGGNLSSISLFSLKEKLSNLNVSENETIIFEVKNAKIVGHDLPINSNCQRGIDLEASNNDISFAKDIELSPVFK